MKKSILILLAGTTLLAGCNLAPKYERPAGAVPVALPQGGVYPAAPTDAQDVSRIGWRDFFLDDRLRQVIETGIANNRSEEHTSELQSLMRISYAVFCLKKKNRINTDRNTNMSKQGHKPNCIKMLQHRTRHT